MLSWYSPDRSSLVLNINFKKLSPFQLELLKGKKEFIPKLHSWLCPFNFPSSVASYKFFNFTFILGLLLKAFLHIFTKFVYELVATNHKSMSDLCLFYAINLKFGMEGAFSIRKKIKEQK